MRDPLTDPQPGDVIQVRPGWTRTVISNNGKRVEFLVHYDDREKGDHTYSTLLSSWAGALEDISAEVIHMATPPAEAAKGRGEK